jgi:hypothetical protein
MAYPSRDQKLPLQINTRENYSAYKLKPQTQGPFTKLPSKKMGQKNIICQNLIKFYQ